ncbi:MAG: hypothetical protein IVW54_14210 [Candidatus Binataceae bacterium]|nr:hypothetical protein [Candidatus Binataceae bacterium]
MKRLFLAFAIVASVALLIGYGTITSVRAQPQSEAPGGPPPPPPPPGGPAQRRGPGMMMPGMGMMGGMSPLRHHQCMLMHERDMGMGAGMGMGMMGSEMGMGMDMGAMPSDSKTMGQLMELRGKTMQMWGQWLEKRGREIEQQGH